MNFLEDSTGGQSTMRVLCTLIVAVIMGVWAYCCMRAGAMLDLPPWCLGALGSALGAKIIQRRVEDAGAPKQPPPAA